MSHFDPRDTKIVMVFTYLMVFNGKFHLENQDSKTIAFQNNYVNLSPLPSLPFFCLTFHYEMMELNKIISKFNQDLGSML